jgi:5-methylcytosine-specific restriction endonuclease McrA
MARKNFSKATKVAAIKRATRESVVYCEECALPAKKWQIDHINPDGLTGTPTLENAKLLCLPCHAEKTNKKDKPAIAQAQRREAKHLGAVRPKATIPAPPKPEKPTTKADQIHALREAEYARRFE